MRLALPYLSYRKENDFMSNILYALYNGYISPSERKPVKSAERDKIIQIIDSENSYFMDKMSPDDCKRFQEMEGLYSQLSDIEQFESFRYSFKLAVMLICEVYADVIRE